MGARYQIARWEAVVIDTSTKTALIAGASGLVGSQLVQRLLEDSRYGRVISIVRRPMAFSHPHLIQRQFDFHRLSEELTRVEADDWFCTIGTTMKQAGTREVFRRVDYEYPMVLASKAAASGAAQFLMVTAMGSSVSSRFFYNRVKGELERDLAALRLKRLHLFRPSLLLGERREFRFGERVGAVVMKGIKPLLTGPYRKFRGIEARTVAIAMISAANRVCEPGVHIYESDQIERLATLPQ